MPNYWVFTDQKMTHKGWFVDTLFKQVHSILADFGYACNEHTSWIIPLRGPDGNITANAVGVKWRAVRDLEYKYAEGVFEVKYNEFIFRHVLHQQILRTYRHIHSSVQEKCRVFQV